MKRFTVSEQLERNSIPEPNSGCLLWMGAASNSGHGRMRIENRWHSPHRVAWTTANGPIPDGLHVLHKCDVGVCINPQHMYLGTHQNNMQDLATRQRPMGNSPLTPDLVREIRGLKGKVPGRKVATDRGLTPNQVFNIWRGVSWANIQ